MIGLMGKLKDVKRGDLIKLSNSKKEKNVVGYVLYPGEIHVRVSPESTLNVNSSVQYHLSEFDKYEILEI